MPHVSRRDFLKQSAVFATISAAAANTAYARTAEFNAVGSSPNDFAAGAATRDITPDPGVPMWGYGDRESAAKDTLDPLFAKAVVLRAGEDAIAIVVTDYGRPPMPGSAKKIRNECQKAGVKDVIFSATHTHGGPILELPDMPHVAMMEEQIVAAVGEAAGNAQPATMAVGRAHIDINHNRRIIKDGKCYMLWRNAERIPTSPIDHTAGVIRFDDANGKTIATLVHYACHPVILGPDNVSFSADWCGAMCNLVEAEAGGVCLFLQGGAGDINPYLDKTPRNEGGAEAVTQAGRKAGRAVLSAMKDLEGAMPDAPAIEYREKPVNAGLRYNLDDPKEVEVLRQAYGRIFDTYIQGLEPNLAVPLGVLVINDDLALSFTPGELFIQHQIDFANHSPVKNAFLCGYANDFHIYFPTVKDAAIGGYGGSTATYVGIGAGEKLVTESTIMVAGMLGKFGPVKPEDFQLLQMD